MKDIWSRRFVRYSVLMAVAGLAVAGGCAPPPGGNPSNTNESSAEFIYPDDYKTTFVEVRECRPSNEHPEQIKVYVNDVGADAYLNDENPLPEGTIVVKEIYMGFDCGDGSGTLSGIAAMVKMEAGFDSDDGDWRWQQVSQPSQLIVFDDKTTCIGCHTDPDCVVRDLMCTVP